MIPKLPPITCRFPQLGSNWRRNLMQNGAQSSGTSVLPKILQTKGLTEKQIQIRTAFLEDEEKRKAQIQWQNLSPDEVEIIKLHDRAVSDGHFTYDDSKLRKKVMTRLRHYLRGSCCGNACRHCIYNQENVPDELKGVKIFNSAFWVEREPPEDLTLDETERREPHFVTRTD